MKTLNISNIDKVKKAKIAEEVGVAIGHRSIKSFANLCKIPVFIFEAILSQESNLINDEDVYKAIAKHSEGRVTENRFKFILEN